jgi:hypothetical protein
VPWVKLTWEAVYSRPIPPHHRKKVSSFWWRDIMTLSDHFFMMAACTVNEGSSQYFWMDTWNLGILQWNFSQLYSFALNKNILAKAFKTCDIQRHFWLPLSAEALEQLNELQTLLHELQYDPNETNGPTSGIQKYIQARKVIYKSLV